MKRRNNPSIHSRMSQSLQNTRTSEYHTHSFISANHTYIHIYPNPPPPFTFHLPPPPETNRGGKKTQTPFQLTQQHEFATSSRINLSHTQPVCIHTTIPYPPTHPRIAQNLISSRHSVQKKKIRCTSTPDEKDLMTPYIDTYVRIYIHEYIYLHDHRSPPSNARYAMRTE